VRAVVYEGFGEPPAVATVADPVPGADGAVVRVAATGLCRSDWHGWMGHDPDELTDGGVHVSLDALGSEAVCAASIGALRKRGRHVQVGLLPDPSRVPMGLVTGRELEVLGAHGMAAHAYPEILGLVAAGRLRPDRLVTSRISLDEAPSALVALSDASPVGITVIRP
jgi:D-arabinose 1-dehydrogenase-like Zn-dependent alcohol dehydrogenase